MHTVYRLLARTSRSNTATLGTLFLLSVLIGACSSNTRDEPVMQPKTLQLGSQIIAYYESRGRGDHIVFVHGNSSSGRAFQQQFESELGDKYHLIALDLPGHGDSPAAANLSAYNLPNYAATVAAAAKALKIEDAVFVGWSLGGHIMLQAQDLLPQAAGFVIFGTPPLAMPPAMEKAFLPNPAMGAGFKAELSEAEATAYASAFFAPDSVLDTSPFVADILATDGNARAGLAASITPDSGLYKSHRDEIEIAATLRVPLAVLHGQQEQLVSEPYIRALEIPSLWRGAVQIIPNAGHAPQWERPNEFNELLAAFVNEANR